MVNARRSHWPSLMLSGADLLVLDEPTNHLDVESIETLEDAIERYEGTVVLVSHDRELLTRADHPAVDPPRPAHYRICSAVSANGNR